MLFAQEVATPTTIIGTLAVISIGLMTLCGWVIKKLLDTSLPSQQALFDRKMEEVTKAFQKQLDEERRKCDERIDKQLASYDARLEKQLASYTANTQQIVDSIEKQTGVMRGEFLALRGTVVNTSAKQ